MNALDADALSEAIRHITDEASQDYMYYIYEQYDEYALVFGCNVAVYKRVQAVAGTQVEPHLAIANSPEFAITDGTWYYPRTGGGKTTAEMWVFTDCLFGDN
jgi:hypothetical protein